MAYRGRGRGGPYRPYEEDRLGPKGGEGLRITIPNADDHGHAGARMSPQRGRGLGDYRGDPRSMQFGIDRDDRQDRPYGGSDSIRVTVGNETFYDRPKDPPQRRLGPPVSEFGDRFPDTSSRDSWGSRDRENANKEEIRSGRDWDSRRERSPQKVWSREKRDPIFDDSYFKKDQDPLYRKDEHLFSETEPRFDTNRELSQGSGSGRFPFGRDFDPVVHNQSQVEVKQPPAATTKPLKSALKSILKKATDLMHSPGVQLMDYGHGSKERTNQPVVKAPAQQAHEMEIDDEDKFLYGDNEEEKNPMSHNNKNLGIDLSFVSRSKEAELFLQTFPIPIPGREPVFQQEKNLWEDSRSQSQLQPENPIHGREPAQGEKNKWDISGTQSHLQPEKSLQMPVEAKKEETALPNDPTIANILKSIGFDFEMSRKMQERAKQDQVEQERFRAAKKTKKAPVRPAVPDSSSFGIDMSASFLGGGLTSLDLKSALGKEKTEEPRTSSYDYSRDEQSLYRNDAFSSSYDNRRASLEHDRLSESLERETNREIRQSPYEGNRDRRQSPYEASRDVRQSPHEGNRERRRSKYESENIPSRPSHATNVDEFLRLIAAKNKATDRQSSERYSQQLPVERQRHEFDENRAVERGQPSVERYEQYTSSTHREPNDERLDIETDRYKQPSPYKARPVSDLRQVLPENFEQRLAADRSISSSERYQAQQASGRYDPQPSSDLHLTDEPLPPGMENLYGVQHSRSNVALMNKEPSPRDKTKLDVWKRLSGGSQKQAPVEAFKFEISVDRKSNRTVLPPKQQEETEIRRVIHIEKKPVPTLTPQDKEKFRREMEERKKRLSVLEKEMERLRKQQNELMRKKQRQKDGHKDPLLVENSKLQDEIAKQISLLRKAAEVNEKMLGSSSSKGKDQAKDAKDEGKLDHSKRSQDRRKDSKERESKDREPRDRDSKDRNSPRRESKDKSNDKDKQKEQSSSKSRAQSNRPGINFKWNINYEYFDPGNHWCKECNIILTNIYDLFQHLHSKKHQSSINQYDRPWMPEALKNPEKIKPKKGQHVVSTMRGVEFMMGVKAFYCRLCETYAGDSTCAEEHLKTHEHNEKYRKYVEENPVYEKRCNLDKAAGVASQKAEECVAKRKADDKKAAIGNTKKARWLDDSDDDDSDGGKEMKDKGWSGYMGRGKMKPTQKESVFESNTKNSKPTDANGNTAKPENNKDKKEEQPPSRFGFKLTSKSKAKQPMSTSWGAVTKGTSRPTNSLSNTNVKTISVPIVGPAFPLRKSKSGLQPAKVTVEPVTPKEEGPATLDMFLSIAGESASDAISKSLPVVKEITPKSILKMPKVKPKDIVTAFSGTPQTDPEKNKIVNVLPEDIPLPVSAPFLDPKQPTKETDVKSEKVDATIETTKTDLKSKTETPEDLKLLEIDPASLKPTPPPSLTEEPTSCDAVSDQSDEGKKKEEEFDDAASSVSGISMEMGSDFEVLDECAED